MFVFTENICVLLSSETQFMEIRDIIRALEQRPDGMRGSLPSFVEQTNAIRVVRGVSE